MRPTHPIVVLRLLAAAALVQAGCEDGGGSGGAGGAGGREEPPSAREPALDRGETGPAPPQGADERHAVTLLPADAPARAVAAQPEQAVTLTFLDDAVAVERDGRPEGPVTIAWTGMGRGDAIETVPAPTRHVAEGATFTLERGSAAEWYANGPAGLEQGFDLGAPGDVDRREPLVLVVELAGLEPGPVLEDRVPIVTPSGEIAFWYGELHVTDRDGRRVHSHLEVDGATIRLVVDDAGAPYPLHVDPLIWTETQRVTGTDGFGRAVSISGEYAVVGMPLDDDKGADSGSVAVYARVNGGWNREAILTATDGVADDRLGSSVGISGTTIVAGAPRSGQVDTGAAYVFTRGASGWTQQAKLNASDMSGLDYYGNAVAISGDTIIVGSDGDTIDQVDTGSAYIYVRSGTTWTEQAKLVANDGAHGDDFGRAVSISGNRALIGAWGDETYRGAAYIFNRAGTSWTQAAKLRASDGAPNDGFGLAVHLTEDTAIVGAPRDDDGITNSGSAYVFVRNASSWPQQAKIRAGDPAEQALFGAGVAVLSDRAVVNAAGDLGTLQKAYAFGRTGTTWTQETSWSFVSQSDLFGTPVALSAGDAMLGEPGASGGPAVRFVVVTAGPGAGCTTSAECSTGFCADGVCCDAACTATCQACSSAKTNAASGTCAPVRANTDPDDECANGSCNGSGACVLAQGQACAAGGQCASGFCVDGVCCESSCTGSCRACSAAKNGVGNGLCRTVPDGADPDAACPTNLCYDGVCCNTACSGECVACNLAGTSGTCAPVTPGTSCGSPATTACSDPDTCNAVGACVPNHRSPGAACGDQGVACRVDDFCDGSGACVDGGLRSPGSACGDATSTACSAPDTCNAAGSCQPNHAPPGAACGDVAGACLLADGCNGAGSCVDGGVAQPGTPCRAAIDVCDAAELCDGVAATCPADGVLASGTSPAAPGCDAFACDGAQAGCPAGCDTGADCIDGAACIDGECAPTLDDGAPCALDAACTSGMCVDGACCDVACGGGDPTDCQECSTGTCSPVAPDAVCRASAAPCDREEVCDGSNLACPADLPADDGTPCGAAGLCTNGACDEPGTGSGGGSSGPSTGSSTGEGGAAAGPGTGGGRGGDGGGDAPSSVGPGAGGEGHAESSAGSGPSATTTGSEASNTAGASVVAASSSDAATAGSGASGPQGASGIGAGDEPPASSGDASGTSPPEEGGCALGRAAGRDWRPASVLLALLALGVRRRGSRRSGPRSRAATA